MNLPRQEWYDTMQLLLAEFVQNDESLGIYMMDCSNNLWDECFDNGLSPEEALKYFLDKHQTPEMPGSSPDA